MNPLTDAQIQAVLSNPWHTSMDIHDMEVQVENERGMADPMVQTLLTLESNLVLAEYLATKEADDE